jgi:diguanylate cyclase (GGDEF)-like protein
MLGLILVIIVYIALALSLFLGLYTLFRSQSQKKNYFLLMQGMIVAYLLGYLLELTGTNAEEAFAGMRVLDLSASFIAVFAFFFVADFCNINLHHVMVKIPMLTLPLALVPMMWGAELRHLIYKDFRFFPGLTRHLIFTAGPLYFLTLYPIVCMVLAIALLLHEIKKWEGKYRKQLLILLICVAFPLAASAIYHIGLLAEKTTGLVYLAPYSLVIMTFWLYLGVIRFNIFETIPMAAISAMDHIREGFILVDEKDNYLFSNPAAETIFPGIKKLLKGESIFSATGWPEELKGKVNSFAEFFVSDKDTRYFRASVSPVLTQNQALIAKIILFCDITDSVILMKELESAAYIDGLTGLYNRKHFFELATPDIARTRRLKQPIYTAMLDLDFFKDINDTYGHAAGDLALVNVASIIRQTIRSYDLLCRYGGEEFLLLITNAGEKEAFNLMERIRENIERNVTDYENVKIEVTCSIGLAKLTQDDTIEDSLKKADEALYAAKNAGRNQVKVYSPVF